tara:strand:- start:1543 stop:2160 length:618 start_codon:yes stop_codon:yes gene_type:complete
MFKLTNIDNNYIMSLCALLQCAHLIDKISISNIENNNEIEVLIKSIYIKDTNDSIKIYKDKKNLFLGFTTLKKILAGNNDISLINIQKYILSILLIQKNLNKINSLKDLIRKKIDNYQENSMMATNLDDLILYSEAIYTDHISIIKPRVIISGKKEYLEVNSSLIRALLLSGIRAAILWSNHGGSKWQLMFRRKEILSKCDKFFI